MNCRFKFAFIYCVICTFSCSYSQKITKMKFKAPKLTEEETESNFLPSLLRCDACMAVVHQINSAFANKEKLTKDKILLESDVLETLEDVCNDGFDSYGLKEVSGVHRLSGPGLETESTPGMVQVGGKWPRRIRDLCVVGVDEIGEMEIYSTFKANSDLKTLFCSKHCARNNAKSEL